MICGNLFERKEKGKPKTQVPNTGTRCTRRIDSVRGAQGQIRENEESKERTHPLRESVSQMVGHPRKATHYFGGILV